MADKLQLREKLRRARLEMSDAEHTLKSREVVERLKGAVDWSKAQTVHFFEPIGELLEVDISGLITELEDDYPDIRLFAPRKIKGQWEMISVKAGQAPEQFDVIIVPMLGFDPKNLQRIGYGGGYYDKFLAGQLKARKIGVCFEAGKTDNLPAEAHDIPTDLIVTENSAYRR